MLSKWKRILGKGARNSNSSQSKNRTLVRKMVVEDLEGRRLLAFTSGNLVVLQTGDGVAAPTNAAAQLTIKEFTTTGVAERVVPIPSSGATTKVTQSGSATSEGNITLSSDGRFLALAGYDASVGTAGVAASTVPRVIGLLAGDESLDLSTTTPSYSANNIRSAATVDGTRVWTAGPNGTGRGLRTTTVGTTADLTSIFEGGNYRVAQVFSNQLYVSTANSIVATTPALPTATVSAPTAFALTGGTAPANIFDFVLLDRDPTANAGGSGYDTLYIADASQGILKYSSANGVNWTNRGVNAALKGNGIEAIIDGSSVVLFGTTNQNAGNKLQRFTDTAAYDAALASSALIDLATAPTNTIFRGIAFAPSTGVFTVPAVASPTFANVGVSAATIGGEVTSSGGTALTARGIVYSSSNNLPVLGAAGVVSAVDTKAGTGVFTVNASGLNPNTTYFFRAFATNAQGNSYSTVGQFTTSSNAVAPTVTSPTSTAISDSGATLGGNVTADGGAGLTDRGIVYSLTSVNSNPAVGGTGVVQVPADSIAVGVFTKTVTGLAASSGYSFAAYAVNASGTGYSTVSTFTTAAPATAPVLDPTTTANVSDVFATASSNVTADGGSAVISRGFVYSVTSINNNPQLAGTGVTSQTVSGTTGVLTANVVGANVGLQPNTTYSIASFATNAIGTTYSPVVTFATATTVPMDVGDLAFTGYSGTSGVERVSFVSLDDIAAGTTVLFTDNGYDSNTGAFATNEGFYALQFTQPFAAGSRFYYDSAARFQNFDGTSTGLFSLVSGNTGFNNSGDSFTAIQGSIANPARYLAQISSGSFVTTGAISTTSTYTAPGLVEGSTAISLRSSASNGVLDSANTAVGSIVFGSTDQIRSVVNSVNNWTVSTSTTLSVPPAISFAFGIKAVPFVSESGLAVDLGQTVTTSLINLYDQANTLGAPDVQVVGNMAGVISGSVVFNATNAGFTFVPTGVDGLLLPDTYTLTLRSGANGFVGANGSPLLTTSGTPGDYVTTFTLTAPSASTVVVSIPDFARGFDQAVNVPNTSTGLPVLLSNGNDIGTVEFQVSYNPALLTISGFTSSVVGATVVTDFSTAGLAKVRVTSTTAFATSDGEFILGAFAATVPLTAPYGSKEVLRISGQSAATPRILRTDGSTVVPALADNAVHLAAFVGDLNGDETYNGVDAILMRRLIVGINSGSLSYQLADPVLFADLNVDGGVGGVDAVISQRLVVGSAGSIVPDLPSSAGTNTSTPGGPDPVIFVPTDLTASAGGTVVVPVRLRVTEAAGIDLTGVSLVMQFDATRFQLASANSISLSPLLTSSGFSQPSVNFSNGNGAIRFFASGATGLLPNGSIETLINVTLNVLPGATSGSSSFNIRANNASLGVGSGNQSTALNNADLATLVLNPAPTNGSADVGVDGVITVTGTSLANPTVVVTAPNAVYSGTAYVGASFTLTGTAAPTPTVSFTYYAGATATGTALAGAPINVGTYTVVASSAANAANNAATSAPVTFQITPKALTATATAGNKIYDGTTAATVAYTSLAGFVGTETVTVSGSGTFASKNAATGIAITATAPVLADGTNGGLAVNYSLPTPTGLTANITAKALTATATAGNKIYDGTTAATVAYTSLAGFVGTETVTVTGSGTFASKNAATGIAVTATAPVLADGTNGGLAVNYSLPTPTGLTANITAKALTATATAGNKIYDGTTAATVAYTSLAGFVGTETVTVSGSGTFASKNAASGIAVTATAPVLADGTNGGLAVNYSLPTPTGLTANITAKALTATATAGNKIYDGTTAATVAYTSLAGFVGTETVTVSGSGTFASKNAASGIAVTATTPVLADGTNGGLAVNYSLPTPTGLTANITAKALTATATAGNKIYDGTTAATVTYTSLAGFVGTETVTVSGSGTFASKNAASGIAVTATAPVLADGTNGGLAVNYSLPTPTGLTANITAKALTATATAGNKIYDGTTAATVAYTSLAGFVGTETVTVSGSGTFASKNAATGIAVTATAPVLADGTNGGLAVNYSLPTPTGLTANITAKALTVAADAKTKGVGAADPAFTFVATGLVPSETIATALSGSLTRDPGETAGTYTIRQGSLAAVNDNYAISFTTNTLTIAQAVTLSGSPLVNAGAAQRSQLTSLTVNFSAPVTLTAGAFSITNIGLTTPESTALAQSQILVNPSFGTAATTFTITFGAGAGVVARSLASGGNSLVDGNYRLDVDATKVVDAVGGNLAGATTFGAAATDNFFRLFGDVDGTGAVDANDLFAWRRATAAYNALFDANGDGAINSVDNDSWKPNYGKRRRAF